ncbi:hypothetical protein MNBD_NITROSPINAE03-2058 [hydrothermal vent metagenome]|uniref:Prepilin-type N-terminal cleavage/methylation domain-containing protein n=1 Tax=hydrothermal vent metagenome TaxID=652676 RepID=A0A3B1BVT5_9ZZZZ
MAFQTRKSNNPAGNQAGFTLIELLAVVAVIAALAAIALPQFQKYRARAYDAAALQDIAQFRAAVANADVFSASSGTWTSGSHPLFTDVGISNLVQIVWSSTVSNGAQVFIAYACNPNGDDGYRVIVPYGAKYTPVGTESPNEIVIGALQRVAAGC